MEMFNVMKTMSNDFRNLLSMAGKEIYINGEEKYALISNIRTLKEFNDKYISTEFNMQRGDIIFYDNKYWMITTQVGSPRYESYKAQIRQVEHDLIFNLSFLNNPSQKYLLKCPSIVSKTSDFTQEYSRTTGMIMINSEIHVFVQDNEKTRRIIELVNKAYGRILFGKRSYEITGISSVNKGVLDITCNLTTTTTGDDYETGIYNTPANYEQFIDESMYALEGIVQGKPLAPNGLQTNVGTITATNIVNQTTSGLGSMTITWVQDASASQYKDFNGYKVTLVKDGSAIATTNVTGLTATFNDLQAGDYVAEVSILFATYTAGQGSLSQASGTFTIANESVKPLPPTDYNTSVSPVGITAVGETSQDSDGVITYTWTTDANADNYSGFVGYELKLTNGSYTEQQLVTLDKTATSYQWTNLSEGQYAGMIRVKFVNGETTTYGSWMTFDIVTIQDNFSGGILW